MRRATRLHTFTTAFCLTTAISTTLAQTPETDSTVTYGAEFFQGSGALTVNDMLDRVPGIEMIPTCRQCPAMATAAWEQRRRF